MTVTVNGETRTIDEGQSVEDLLRALGLDKERCAVERNATLVSPSERSATRLCDGDRVEIVRFVGGG